MSKIGKKPVFIPDGVDVKIDGNLITANGPKGTLQREFPDSIKVEIENGKAMISPAGEKAGQSEIWGLWRALFSNMVIGVSKGFEKILDFTGIGFKAAVSGDLLELNLGFSHPVKIKTPEGITFKTEKGVIIISGADKEKVGHIAALIRAKRPPEPYKGSGIKYREEVIKRKAGKKAVATG
ncbi:MAG: large subunit ribosomal protein L6 [Parcubacteria group bacterium Licking1014_17]|nr:MAG: large subunit ribosomal protein L6 [Parcubacteria group bacterium Licking1014_17]